MQLIRSDLPPQGWDDWLVEAGLESGFCQTTARAHSHSLLHGSRPVYLIVEEDGEWLAGAQILNMPVNPKRPDAGIRMFCDEGPVLHGDTKALGIILNGIIDIARAENTESLRIYPPVLAHWINDESNESLLAACACNHWQTSVVDISTDEDTLFSSLERSIKKSIRKCRKLGITVHSCQSVDEFVTSFLNPYTSANGQVLDATKLQGYRAWWTVVNQSGYLFLYARDPQGRVLATLGSIGFAGMATEIMSARTPESYSINASPQDLLHWESFCHHARMKQRYFNLAGFSPSPMSDKEQGIRRYKEKWPGRVLDYPLYTWQPRSLRKKLAGIIQPARDRLYALWPGKPD